MTLRVENFAFVRTLLRRSSGHLLEDDKAYLVETRLLPVARTFGFDSVDTLLDRLRVAPTPRVADAVVQAMTINETFFFRDGRPFDLLRDQILPELIRRRATQRRLALWSAACSTGQEPYSLAILLQAFASTLQTWTVRLIASDLTESVLERAREGVYSELEMTRGLTEEQRNAWFRQTAAGWHIKDELRDQVEFRALNLSVPLPVLPKFDLILLRNVLIYFDAETRLQVLLNVRRVLLPDGYLMLGAGERVRQLDEWFEPAPAAPGFYQPRARPDR